jgi:hypothetical protein
VAAHDQILSIKYFNKNMKGETEGKCKLCKGYEEDIYYLTSDVPFWQRMDTL